MLQCFLGERNFPSDVFAKLPCCREWKLTSDELERDISNRPSIDNSGIRRVQPVPRVDGLGVVIICQQSLNLWRHITSCTGVGSKRREILFEPLAQTKICNLYLPIWSSLGDE
jgi:hypothetical protein